MLSLTRIKAFGHPLQQEGLGDGLLSPELAVFAPSNCTTVLTIEAMDAFHTPPQF